MKKAHTKLDERVSLTVLLGSSRLMIAVTRAEHRLSVVNGNRVTIMACSGLLGINHT